jgi:ferredoxin
VNFNYSYNDANQRSRVNLAGGSFWLYSKCKGCAECVDACGNHGALAMLKKDDAELKRYQRTWNFYKKLPETPKQYINERLLSDMMLAERLSLQGNPSDKQDWFIEPKTNEVYNFVKFARTEGRFAKHFDKDGNPSETILASNQERLDNWHTLQELAGII